MNPIHIDAYWETGKFAGWPANHGMWAFGDEIVVGYTLGTLETRDIPGHKISKDEPSYTRQSRSTNGGLTWSFEAPDEIADPFSMEAEIFEGGLDFTDPELALRFVPNGVHAGDYSVFYYSIDRCRSWIGPYKVTHMGLSGIASRTELLALNSEEAILFFAAPKSDGYEGRACCAMIRGGGASFEFLSYIGDEPPGFTIMPASYMRKDGSIIAILREQDRFDNPNKAARLSQFISKDLGKTWTFDQYVVQLKHSTPPALKPAKDGRLCCVYGYRDEPNFGVRYKMSADEGRTWSDERILRSDGNSTDLGYTRLVALPDGSMLTAYYYNTQRNSEHFIGVTKFFL